MKTGILKKQPDRTTSVAAVSTLTGRSNVSPERLKVEAWLDRATRAHTTKFIAASTGLSIDRVRSYCSSMVSSGTLVNVCPNKNLEAQYITPDKVKKQDPSTRVARYVPPSMPSGYWTQPKPARAGADDHIKVPSLRADGRVMHIPMMLMASKVRGGESAR